VKQQKDDDVSKRALSHYLQQQKYWRKESDPSGIRSIYTTLKNFFKHSVSTSFEFFWRTWEKPGKPETKRWDYV